MQEFIRIADKTAFAVHLEVNFARVARTSRLFNTALFIASHGMAQRSFIACCEGGHVQKKEAQSKSSPSVWYSTSEKNAAP
jgi:hypothetical protein